MTSPSKLLACAGLLLGMAAASPGPDAEAVTRGRALFEDTRDDEYPSCAHCHNRMPEAEEIKKAEFLGPGVTLYGAAVREGWRNRSTYADVGEASQTCAKRWQKRKGGFDAARRADLVAYLRTIAPKGKLPRRKVQRRPRLLKDLAGGDAAKGRKLTRRHCGACHNAAENAVSFELKEHGKRRDVVARKVRGYDAKRKFKPEEGSMSYFTNDRLSDEALRHILAHLGR